MRLKRVLRHAVLINAALLPLISQTTAVNTPPTSRSAFNSSVLTAAIQQVLARPEYRHSDFGIEFYSLDRDAVLYALNPSKLFTPASTTKLLTEGTALEVLGPDFRFRTPVYRTGPIRDGVLSGDLVLVASGDPNLSNRIQPNGTLAFENEDHSYDGSPDTRAVPGDPLLVVRELARQIHEHGIRSITGRVVVDVSLFPEGEAELGTGEIISPICVNDNIVDMTATAGNSVGSPVALQISPQTSYLTVVNQLTTGTSDSKPEFHIASDIAAADGTHTITVTGSMPASRPSILYAYGVPQPSRFAEIVLTEALRADGVQIALPNTGQVPVRPDPQALARAYVPANVVAEHTSPPLSEEVKVTLKVSQNLHASMVPFILGAVVAHKNKDIGQAGFDIEHDFLARAGLDLSGASQGDGAGGSQAAFFAPDFVVQYLRYMSRQKNFAFFRDALPVLGHDGTLWNIQTQSVAAGHVFAKTGTYFAYDALNHNDMVTGKGLAGYLTTPRGEHIAFAIYANRVAIPIEPEAITRIVGQGLGEIATAGYLAGQ
jgi:D-alanyl-D-alanine carboxypeptidase/D-alanyl-D-alanine-endopeptidase (penicillin-binding protein 4)